MADKKETMVTVQGPNDFWVTVPESRVAEIAEARERWEKAGRPAPKLSETDKQKLLEFRKRREQRKS